MLFYSVLQFIKPRYPAFPKGQTGSIAICIYDLRRLSTLAGMTEIRVCLNRCLNIDVESVVLANECVYHLVSLFYWKAKSIQFRYEYHTPQTLPHLLHFDLPKRFLRIQPTHLGPGRLSQQPASLLPSQYSLARPQRQGPNPKLPPTFLLPPSSFLSFTSQHKHHKTIKKMSKPIKPIKKTSFSSTSLPNTVVCLLFSPALVAESLRTRRTKDSTM